jgi:hypothetical protein
MMVFDASNRDQCEVKRTSTNTPLQALVMMNDPTVMEASRVLATRLAEEKTTVENKIEKAFRLIICRKPKEQEIKLLQSYYLQNQQALKAENINKLLSIGEYNLPLRANKEVVAAMMLTISNIYNLEEAITK